jgi:hypothetical protein
MKVIDVRNVNEALPEGIYHLSSCGLPERSRAGEVKVAPTPVTTVYRKPAERVLFNGRRDANPFFHLFESLWMLAGRNDTEFITGLNKNMTKYSDDGVTFHGAYGHRWRAHFQGMDQLEMILALLSNAPWTRRAVLTIWDPAQDLYPEECGADLPCNDLVFFWRSRGVQDQPDKLNMTVSCRSNDIIWGAYGANAVHFSILQEYMARSLGLQVGTYWQVSNNFHAYRTTLDPLVHLQNDRRDGYSGRFYEPYEQGEVEPYPLMQVDRETWDRDLALFFENPMSVGFEDPFFLRVAQPLWAAFQAWKHKADPNRFEKAARCLARCHATDWRLAAGQWIQRRHAEAVAKGKPVQTTQTELEEFLG